MEKKDDNQFLIAEDLEQADAKPLTNWKNPPKVKDLKQDLESAAPIHAAQKEKIQEWLDNLNVEGKAKPKPVKGRSSVTPRLIRKQAEWRYAALSEPFLSNSELFKVSPVTWEDKQAAEHNQLILAKQFDVDINKTAFIDEYVRTAVDEGTVILRVGWEFIEEEVEKEVPIVELIPSEEAIQLHEELAQLKMNSPAEYEEGIPEELKIAHEDFLVTQIPSIPNVIGYEKEQVMETVVNRPTVEVCNTRNVIIDPTCNGDIKKANFVIYSFESDLATLRKNPNYSNLDKVIPPESPLQAPDHEVSEELQSFAFHDEPRKKLVVYEYWGYWDIHGNGTVVPIVASWVGNTMIRLQENPYPDKEIPFIVVQYLPVRKSVYGEPDGALLAENQQIAGAVLRGMIDLMGKSANSQTGFQKGVLDPINRKRYESGLDYEYNGQNPEAAIRMHKFPEIPASAQYLLDLQNIEAESITGVKSFSQGMSQASLGNVATAVRGVLDAASKREVGILRRLAEGIVQVGRKFISMNAEFLSEKEIVRITNEEFRVIYRDSLAGNFDLKLTISTPEQDEAKAQELAFMLQTLGNNLDFNITKMVMADIAKLRKMPDLAKRIEDFEPQPDPMAEQMAMMELELMRAKIRSEQAKAIYYETYSGLNEGRTNTEYVKQAQIQAETDLANLDFIEQESGVKQAREKELRGEQARSQMDLKLLDHSLKEESKEREAIRNYLMSRNATNNSI